MTKPNKPYDGYPLTPCDNGQWRIIRKNKVYYFGSWLNDRKGEQALLNWLARQDAIMAGVDRGQQDKAPSGDGLTVAALVVRYLNERSRDVESRNLSPDSFRDYTFALNDFTKSLPRGARVSPALRPLFGDYVRAMETRGCGPHAIKRHVTIVKMMFRYAAGEGWCEAMPFGRSFSAPPTDTESVAQYHDRKGDVAKTERTITRKEVRKLLRAVCHDARWKAIILLLLNTGMNPAEIARVKWSEIDFESGRLSRRRGKTSKRQECYLWKRTRHALKAFVIPSEYLFIRKNGKPLVGSESRIKGHVRVVHRWNKITKAFGQLLTDIGISGVTPYTLRRTARTLAAHCRDDGAAKRMMGHALVGQDQAYVKGRFPLSRLKRIGLTIYRKLFGKPKPKLRIAEAA